jgi:Ca2+-binding RTX toxin-like protein
LPDNVEALILTGAGHINGTGTDRGNQLLGNSGSNVLTGGKGNDIIDGGGGNDKLFGGLGNDVFRFKPGNGSDTILDFSAHGERDIIDLSAFHGHMADLHISRADGGLSVSFGIGDVLHVIGANHLAAVGDYLQA